MGLAEHTLDSRLATNERTERAMLTGWFLCPYKEKSLISHPVVRYVAMDDLTKEIQACGGDWSESEQDGNQAIVRVRGTNGLLNALGLVHRRLSETEARAIWRPSRPVPGSSSRRRVATKSLYTLMREVQTSLPSKEEQRLKSIWRAVGFGQGWRLPHGVIRAGVRSGYPPIGGGAFPTTSVLDNFTGSDEDPIATNWAGPIRVDVSNQMRRVSNAARSVVGGAACSSYYDIGTFGPDSEAFMTWSTVTTTDNDHLDLFMRISSPGTAGQVDYYFANFIKYAGAADSIAWQYTLDGVGPTLIGSEQFTADFAAGDAAGAEVIGSTLQAYRKPSGGSWETFGSSRSDSNVTAAGYIGIGGADNSTSIFDDFGGGTVVAAGGGPTDGQTVIWVGVI